MSSHLCLKHYSVVANFTAEFSIILFKANGLFARISLTFSPQALRLFFFRFTGSVGRTICCNVFYYNKRCLSDLKKPSHSAAGIGFPCRAMTHQFWCIWSIVLSLLLTLIKVALRSNCRIMMSWINLSELQSALL